RVEAAGRADDSRHLRLQLPDPHLVADVTRLAEIGGVLDAGDADVASRRDTHRRIFEGADQGLQRALFDAHRGVGVDHDVAGEVGAGRVFGGRLAAAL